MGGTARRQLSNASTKTSATMRKKSNHSREKRRRSHRRRRGETFVIGLPALVFFSHLEMPGKLRDTGMRETLIVVVAHADSLPVRAGVEDDLFIFRE